MNETICMKSPLKIIIKKITLRTNFDTLYLSAANDKTESPCKNPTANDKNVEFMETI